MHIYIYIRCIYKRNRILASSRYPSRVCLLRFVAFSHALAPGASGFQPYSSPTLSCWIVWAPCGAPKTERAVGAVLQCVCAETFLQIQRCFANV